MALSDEPDAAGRSPSWRKLGQGIAVLHEDRHPEVDILAVPGLGANPKECWTWKAGVKKDGKRSKTTNAIPLLDSAEPDLDAAEQERSFNWIRDADGIASLFPRSRIMLYDYASAWYGSKKVKATMKGICTWLLDDLKEKRKDGTEITRPLIMIGHSMGGIVVAKTLCMARNRRDFEAILTCTVGCLFFGTPFQGTNMAKIALGMSSIFGNEAFEALLQFMKAERNDALDEVTNDFMEICKALDPKIDLHCFYELVSTDVSYSDRLTSGIGGLLQQKAFKASARIAVDLGTKAFGLGSHFVEERSAVLPGSHAIGLQMDHRDLIKFESVASEKFGPVKIALSTIVRNAKTNARKRALRSGQNLMTQKTVNQVRRSLESVDMAFKFRTREREQGIKSWLTDAEPEYQAWLSNVAPSSGHQSFVWLKGGPGLGKTDASLAAIQKIGSAGSLDQLSDLTVGSGGSFLAFFLCESAPACKTSEDILKSFITQLIDQDDSLAQHAVRWFVPNTRSRGPARTEGQRSGEQIGATGAKATTTVDNLWKCLLDMIDDPIVNNVHFVINNFHVLDADSSTDALLSKLRDHAISLNDTKSADRRAKWLITSRDDKHISERLSTDCISMIDMENNSEYGATKRLARQEHARNEVTRLRANKNYSFDLAFYVRSSIERQSEDKTWIDIVCILLRAMPNDSSNLTVTKWLKEVSAYHIDKLIDHAWNQILVRNTAVKLEIEEVLQALTIAFEPPTLSDLAVLAQMEDLQMLTDLVQRCYPILEISDYGENQGKVIFKHEEFKKRLSFTSHDDLGYQGSQRRQYHGLVALRCFKYIKSWYKNTAPPARLANVAASLIRSPSTSRAIRDETSLIDLDDDADEVVGSPVASISKSESPGGCSYPIKYLFKHLGEGFPDAAQELCEDDPDFWGKESGLRNAWLNDFRVLNTDLRSLNVNGLSALHVAAGIGANELVTVLVTRYGRAALSWRSGDGMTALHVAAFNNQSEVVDALVRAGADIEAGEGAAGTALHQAALRGNCAVIAVLLAKGASVNALSNKDGPVINAAIRSGTVEAVKQIMDGDVRFDLDYTQTDAPLSLSARLSEPSLFHDILQTGKEKWLQNVKLLDQALIAASYSGRLESVRILLDFAPAYTNNTLEEAILSAARQKMWTSVLTLLEYVINSTSGGMRRDFRLENVFYLAATSREDRSREDQIEVLEKIWSFESATIGQDVRDYSLYEAIVLRKNSTVVWLLETCHADADATAEKPAAVMSEVTTGVSPSDFWTPLNAAAGTGNAPLVRILLDKGANIDDERCYALQLAAREGHTEVVQLLLERGAPVSKQKSASEDFGFSSGTALQVACENNRPDVVETLIHHGANPNLGAGMLCNPITAATQMTEDTVLKLLLEVPEIDVNVTGGEDQSSPLINAATHMSTEAVRLLVEKGADVNAQNAAGDTALIMAATRGDEACVDLLCDNNADVTYRSPRRGLAIQIAAEGLHPLCAHTLAERMGGTIEGFREKEGSDLVSTKQKLQDTIEELRRRDADIDTLRSRLNETEDQLDIARKDAEFHQLEKEQLKSMHSLQGETYLSQMEQMKAVKNERDELAKQLNASKGQNELANVTITNLQGIVQDERRKNAELRTRYGYAALQEEKRAAIEMAEQEKQSAIEAAKLEEQRREELFQKIQILDNDNSHLKGELKSAQASAGIAIEKSSHERQQRVDLEGEISTLQSKIQELEDALSTVQAAADRTRARAGSPLSSSATAAEVMPNKDYFAQRDMSANGTPGSFEVIGSPAFPGFTEGMSPLKPVTSPLSASPGAIESPPTSPNQRPNNALANGRTMSGQSQTTFMSHRGPHRADGSFGGYPSGFRTIHGQHRADGSLGGYRRDRMVKRNTSDSLYDSSINNGVAGARTMSSQSSYSNESTDPNNAEPA